VLLFDDVFFWVILANFLQVLPSVKKKMAHGPQFEKCHMFGCLLGMLAFAAIGSFKIIEGYAHGACTTNETGFCLRTCSDEFLVHCRYSPAYRNTTFQPGGITCTWHTTALFLNEHVCTSALVDVGFQGPCSANGETCFDRYAAHAGMAVGAIFIIISACYTMFLTYMCYQLQTRRHERHVQLQ